MKRLMDPRLSAPLLAEIEGIIAGSDEALARARKANKLDYVPLPAALVQQVESYVSANLK